MGSYCKKKKAVRLNFQAGTHRTIQKSKSLLKFAQFSSGIRINNYFWIFGGEQNDDIQQELPEFSHDDSTSNLYRPKTLLWSIRKERWFRGT